MIAHVGGVPVEEVLPGVVGGFGAVLVAFTWVAARVRRKVTSEDR